MWLDLARLIHLHVLLGLPNEENGGKGHVDLP